MAVYRVLGKQVVTKQEFIASLEASGGAVTEGADAHEESEAYVTEAAVVKSPGATAFVPIGLGKPLTILIRHVYSGKNPKPGFLGGGAKKMVVVTGLKDYSAYAASSRAVNYLLDAKPNDLFKAPPSFTQGTNVVAYSPAVLTDAFTFTVEMAFDRFPEELLSAISNGLSGAAGIPLLMPAQGYLMGASQLIRIGSAWADALIDGKALWSHTDTIDFNTPGVPVATADFRVLAHFDATGMTYDPLQGLIQKDGALYKGDEPYVVISLDGAERKNLEKFSPTVASAAILKKFFSMRDGAEASVEALVDGLKLASDMKYWQDAKGLRSQLASASADSKPALQAQLDATLKNILNPDLRGAG